MVLVDGVLAVGLSARAVCWWPFAKLVPIGEAGSVSLRTTVLAPCALISVSAHASHRMKAIAVSTKIQPIVHQVALQVKDVDCGELIRTPANCLAGCE